MADQLQTGQPHLVELPDPRLAPHRQPPPSHAQRDLLRHEADLQAGGLATHLGLQRQPLQPGLVQDLVQDLDVAALAPGRIDRHPSGGMRIEARRRRPGQAFAAAGQQTLPGQGRHGRAPFQRQHRLPAHIMELQPAPDGTARREHLERKAPGPAPRVGLEPGGRALRRVRRHQRQPSGRRRHPAPPRIDLDAAARVAAAEPGRTEGLDPVEQPGHVLRQPHRAQHHLLRPSFHRDSSDRRQDSSGEKSAGWQEPGRVPW